MDQISGLPKYVLHDMLSRLPTKDAVRTSVLSRAWRETWSTFPILSISDTQIIGTFPQPHLDFLRKRKIFLEHVKKRLLSFHDNGLAIKEFKLILNCFDHQYMSQDIDLWLKLASESGVEVLQLCLPEGPELNGQKQWYALPPGVLEAKSLKKIELMGGIRIDQAFLNHPIKSCSFRELSLWSVLLGGEGAIEHLISHCPMIEHITLKCCYVHVPLSNGAISLPMASELKSLSMNGLQKLKQVDVQGIQEFYIDAPNLENLLYCPGHINAPFQLNFNSCRNLRCLYLWSLKSTVIADKWLVELFSKCPFLESLKLDNCSLSERINISSAQLKVLDLSSCSNLKEVNIDAPNLLLCGYYGDGGSKPIVCFLRSSSQLKVNVMIDLDFMDLYNLREAIQNFKPLKFLASLSLFIHRPITVQPNPHVMQDSSPLPIIKRLHLRAVPKDEALYLPLVNRLLSSCYPETISFSLHSYFCPKTFIEYMYETLMGERQDECYCRSRNAKCWWHGLKNVKFTSSVKTDVKSDFKTMLDALPTYAIRDNISFQLES